MRTTHYVLAVAAIAVSAMAMPFDSDGNLIQQQSKEQITQEDIPEPDPLAVASGMPPIPGASANIFSTQRIEAAATAHFEKLLAAPLQGTNDVVPETMPPLDKKASLIEVAPSETVDGVKLPNRIPSKPISEGITYEGERLGVARENAKATTEEVVHDEISNTKVSTKALIADTKKAGADDAAQVVAHEQKVQKQIEKQGASEVNAIASDLKVREGQDPDAAAKKPVQHVKPVGADGKPTAGMPGTTTTHSNAGSRTVVECDSTMSKHCAAKCGICVECAKAINAAKKCDACKQQTCVNCVPFAKCLPTGEEAGSKKEAAAQAANVAAAKAAADKRPASKKGRAGVLTPEARKALMEKGQGPKGQGPKGPAAHALKTSIGAHSAASAACSVTVLTVGLTALVALMQ